jgi:hypothetical protein
MANARNLKRIDLYCPQYKTDATIRIVENHPPSEKPHIVVEYEKGGHEGRKDFAATIPAYWGDADLAKLIFLPLPERKDRNWPAWEIPARDHGESELFKFWEG